MSQQWKNQQQRFVMQQTAGPEIAAQSPLQHAELSKMTGPAAAGVTIRELALQAHLTLRCQSENTEQLAVVQSILGVALPVQPLTSARANDRVIRWLSPDEWLVSLPAQDAYATEYALQQQLPGHFSVVNGSGGLTVLQLSGTRVVEVLKKCVSVDLHLREFPVGKVVSTVFAKTVAIVHRTGEQEFELVLRRSFADYIWLWLQDASREFGLMVKT